MILFWVVPNAIAAVWIVFEIWLVVRDRVRGQGKTEKDRGTAFYIFGSVTAGMTAAGLIAGYTGLFLVGGRTSSLLWSGSVLMLLGLVLRIWSVATLGASFRITVETHKNQKVVETGPYRLVRHPSYAGLVLLCCGYGLAVQNWLSLIVAIVVPLAALLYRINVEEAFLATQLGSEYREYQKRTRRLIPWIW